MRSIIFSYSEACVGYRIERNDLPENKYPGDKYTKILFFEFYSYLLPNVTLRLRVKQTIPQDLYSDMVGMISYNRKGDSREYIDHMPDDYIQLLLRIDF